MGLVKIAAVVSNGSKGLFIFSNKLEAELEPVYFIEGGWRKAGMLIN